MSKRGRVYANVSEPAAKMGTTPGQGRRQPREEEVGGGERWQRAADRRKSPFFPTGGAAGQISSSNDAAAGASTGTATGRQTGGGRGAASGRAARSAAAAGTGSSRYASAPTGKFAGELNADALYRDEADRQTLENMNEFEREAELARRYEELVRERQRAELLRRQDRSGAEERTSGRLGEALSDIRARRARQKQLQQRPTSDEEEEEEEGPEEESVASGGHALLASAAAAEEDSEEMSVSLSSSEEEGEALSTRVSVDEGARGPPATAEAPGAPDAPESKGGDAAAAGGDEGAAAAAVDAAAAGAVVDAVANGELKGEVFDTAEQRQAAFAAAAAAQPSAADEAITVQQREEEVRGDDLFEEDRIDTDEQRKKELARRMLQRVSLDLLNAARLSIERLTLMLEHPQAEKFVCGCYVKVPQQQQQQQRGNLAGSNSSNAVLLGAAAAASTPCWVCQIVGLKPCDPYPVRLPTAAAAASCSYRLVLRLAPKAPPRFDREFALTDLVSAPVTPSEFEDWKRKLEEFDTVEDVSRRIRMKLQMLKEFTFTDEDVQTILSRKRESGCAAAVVQTSGSLLKQLMFVKHQLDTLHHSLSSAATAASSRKDLKEKLQLLQEKKADLEARLARSKAATGGQRELLHRLSVEARLARRREIAAPLLLTRSSHRRPSNSSSSRELRQWQSPAPHALGGGGGRISSASAAAAEKQRAAAAAAIAAAATAPRSAAAAVAARRSSSDRVAAAGAGAPPAAAAALLGGAGSSSSNILSDACVAGEETAVRRRQRSPLEEKEEVQAAAAAASPATLPAAAGRTSSHSSRPPAGAAAAGGVAWSAGDPTAAAATATARLSPQRNDPMSPVAEAASGADAAAVVGTAEEAWRMLLEGTRQQQHAWMQRILESQRAAGKFRIEKTIPPPSPYASIVSLLPYSPPPAGRGLLISLEEYKQQVAQLANLQLAG